MRVFYSGGSPIAETGLRNPAADIMLSFWVDTRAKKTEPNARMRAIFQVREEKKRGQKRKAKGKKVSGKSSGKAKPGRVPAKTR